MKNLLFILFLGFSFLTVGAVPAAQPSPGSYTWFQDQPKETFLTKAKSFAKTMTKKAMYSWYSISFSVGSLLFTLLGYPIWAVVWVLGAVVFLILALTAKD